MRPRRRDGLRSRTEDSVHSFISLASERIAGSATQSTRKLIDSQVGRRQCDSVSATDRIRVRVPKPRRESPRRFSGPRFNATGFGACGDWGDAMLRRFVRRKVFPRLCGEGRRGTPFSALQRKPQRDPSSRAECERDCDSGARKGGEAATARPWTIGSRLGDGCSDSLSFLPLIVVRLLFFRNYR